MEMVRTFKITRTTLDRALIPAPNGYLPDVATTFEDGYMRQQFGERLEVILHLETNKAILKIDGKEAAKFAGLTVGAWGNMLYSLQQIYNKLTNTTAI